MDTIIWICQAVAAAGIANVWLVRSRKATAFRGCGSASLKEEFAAYGLPGWFMYAIGALKLTCAAGLVVGIWVPELAAPAAIGLGVLMLGALSMHLKVKDPASRSLPALTMLALCVVVAVG